MIEALNSVGRAVRGARVLIPGESPALRLMERRAPRRARLSHHDPYLPELPWLGLSSQELAPAVEAADLVVIVTAHPGVDHEHVARQASLTLDLRGVTREVDAENFMRL